MSDAAADRLERVEAHLAHLERQVEQLNEVLIEQGKLVARLKKEVQRQSTAMQTLELERVKANNPRPPHYQ
jgi:uncharacterized coiled-coil protein SlyX